MGNQNSEKVMRVIEVLNKARSMELQSIHQYMNQHYNLDDLDYGKFAASIKRIAIDEMDHAEQFAERIKELDGEPGTEMAAKVVKKQALKEVYPFDARLEADVLEAYNGFLAVCRENGDIISANLFMKILAEEQAHYDYFDNYASHISTLGDAFLARIAGTDGSIGETQMGFVKNQG